MLRLVDFGRASTQNDDVPFNYEESGITENLFGSSEQLACIPGMICATKQRHCTTEFTTLVVRKKFETNFLKFKGLWHIFNINKNELIYECRNKSFFKERKVLVEIATGLPVLNFNMKNSLFSNKFNIRQGESKSKDERIGVCHMKHLSFTTKLTFDFQDFLTGEDQKVVVQGNHNVKDLKVYLGEPKEGGTQIAQIYNPPANKFREDAYHVNIGTGIDMALIMGLVLLIDDFACY